MFAINLSYHQVKALVRDLVEFERQAEVRTDEFGKGLYRGQALAYRDMLNITYTDEEITEIINEIGADGNDEQ